MNGFLIAAAIGNGLATLLHVGCIFLAPVGIGFLGQVSKWQHGQSKGAADRPLLRRLLWWCLAFSRCIRCLAHK